MNGGRLFNLTEHRIATSQAIGIEERQNRKWIYNIEKDLKDMNLNMRDALHIV